VTGSGFASLCVSALANQEINNIKRKLDRVNLNRTFLGLPRLGWEEKSTETFKG